MVILACARWIRTVLGWTTFAAMLAVATAPRAEDIHWRSHINVRVNAKDGSIGAPDPGELVAAKVSREIDYISLTLEHAFFRNMPGFRKKHRVAVGVEVEGILPDGRTLKTVGDLSQCTDSDCHVSFDEIPILQPALYPGRNVTFTITMRAAGEDEAKGFSGRIQGVAGILKKLGPGTDSALRAAASLHEMIIEGSSGAPITWKYRFSRYPADAVIGEDPSALLTAGRHVILALPPRDAPEELRRLKPERLLRELKWSGRRLVWRSSGEEYQGTPYVVLAVTRYKRYPNPDTELQTLKRRLVAAIEAGNADAAERHLRAMPAAITEDKILTNAERQLERTWLDEFSARLAAERAKAQNDAGAERNALRTQLAALLDVQEQFGHILEPAEKKDLEFRGRRVRRRIEVLDEKIGDGGSAALKKRIEEAAAEVKRVRAALKEEKERLRRVLATRLSTTADGFIEVQIKVERVAGESDTSRRARALEEARRGVVARVLGDAPKDRYIGAHLAGLESQRVKEPLTDLMGDALIVEERIVKEGATESGGYEIHFAAKVVRRGARSDPGFRVKLGLSKPSFVEGEEAVVSATPTRDAHLYLLSVGADGEVTVLVPNQFVDVPSVKAGETYTFPSAEIRARQIQIKAMLPKGAKESVETVKVIALRRKIELFPHTTGASPFQSVDGKSTLLLTSILQKLAVLDPDAWCNDSVRYTIRAR